MYSTQKSIQILVSLLKQYDVRNIVISPGSRNMAFVRSVEMDPFFNCYSVVDERSAAYFAIGIWLETGKPVALSSTSAQATRNYIPGMTEAFYRGAQLIFITGDYRPSMIGQGVMQAIDQLSIPRDSARLSVALPVVRDADDHRYCVRLVNQALLELDHRGTGPVHIDVPTEEHWGGGVATLPKAAKINRHIEPSTFPDIGMQRVLMVVGQHRPFTPEEQHALDDFSVKHNTAVYVNLLSNYRGPRAIYANLLFEAKGIGVFKEYEPDIIITIGGQHGDYALNSVLQNAWNSPVWRVHEDGDIVDTYKRLNNVFEMSPHKFLTAYSSKSLHQEGAPDYFNSWIPMLAKRSIPRNLPLSHAYVASKLMPRIPDDSVVHFGILSSLRNWTYFEPEVDFDGYSNVAAFGIDGGLSTFIGQTVASERLCFLVIGDLAFFYDMNVLGNRNIRNNARIVLVNNSGGGEFRLFSHAASEFGEDSNKHIAAAGHNGSAQAWAESMGWDYVPVKSKDEFDKNIERIVSPSNNPILTEVFTTMQDDSQGVRKMLGQNAEQSLRRKAALSPSPQSKRKIRKVLKRLK